MLWQRVLFGALMIAAISGVIALDGWLSTRALADSGESAISEPAVLLPCALPITLLVALLVLLATYELGKLCQVGGHQPVVHWAAFVAAGLAIIPWIEMQQRLVGPDVPIPLVASHISLTVFWLSGGFLGTCLAVLMRKTTHQAVGNISLTVLIIFYLGLLSSFALRIRCLWPGSSGALLFIYYILTVKFGDIGAYFVGKSLGKNKLAEWLSPNKTIEGFLGALIMASLVAVGGMICWAQLSLWPGRAPLNLLQAIVFGIVMTITGHLGDLVESAIKRDLGAKDSSKVIPAFGGLLDLLDSVIFTAPIAWWLLTFWIGIG